MSAAKTRLRTDSNSHMLDSSAVGAGQFATTRVAKPKGISARAGSGAWRARRASLSHGLIFSFIAFCFPHLCQMLFYFAPRAKRPHLDEGCVPAGDRLNLCD